VEFYVGMHHPSDAARVPLCMVSVARLRTRHSDFPTPPGGWMLDSGAFSELTRYGHYRDAPGIYAAQIVRWARCGLMRAAASQDYMCEPFVLARTGLSVADHQRLTIGRYDAIRALVPPSIHVLPVIQGYLPQHYAAHVAAYGDRLTPGMWVGVGSVCKRNGNPRDVAGVLRAIRHARPDLRLHGFGLKITALRSQEVRVMLHSADSMAWSFAARRSGGDANSWREALAYYERVAANAPPPPTPMEHLWNA
jgi:hypothetical protein